MISSRTHYTFILHFHTAWAIVVAEQIPSGLFWNLQTKTEIRMGNFIPEADVECHAPCHMTLETSFCQIVFWQCIEWIGIAWTIKSFHTLTSDLRHSIKYLGILYNAEFHAYYLACTNSTFIVDARSACLNKRSFPMFCSIIFNFSEVWFILIFTYWYI